MTLAAVEKRCAELPDSVLTTPFGPHVRVFKTAGKMFALCGHLDGDEVVSLKCDPERSTTLRLTFPAITGGYHLNKLHWNTVKLDGSVPTTLIRELVDHAHDVVASAAKPKRRATSSSASGAKRGTRRGT